MSTVAFTILSALDALITRQALASGLFVEGNPSPVAQMFGANIVLRALIGAYVMMVTNRHDQDGWITWCLLVGMVGVVLYNLAMYFSVLLIV